MWYALPVVGITATNLRRLVNADANAAETADVTATPNSDGEKFTYVYNPWGQLVEIKKIGGGSVTNAKYTYSAMGHRISEQLDTNDSLNSGLGDGVVDAYDPKFFIATDPSGRRLATYRGTDSDPKETFIHHDARIRGPVHQGGPILRDRNTDLADKPFYWASEPAASDRYERHYYALDYRGYVSAIFAGDGTLVEQIRYSATGVPFNIPLGDVEGNGMVESTGMGNPDYDQIEYMWKTPAYHVRGDLDLDGDVDAADLAIAQARDGMGTGRGCLTLHGAGHRQVKGRREYVSGNIGLTLSSDSMGVIIIPAIDYIRRVRDLSGICPHGQVYNPFTGRCVTTPAWIPWDQPQGPPTSSPLDVTLDCNECLKLVRNSDQIVKSLESRIVASGCRLPSVSFGSCNGHIGKLDREPVPGSICINNVSPYNPGLNVGQGCRQTIVEPLPDNPTEEDIDRMLETQREACNCKCVAEVLRHELQHALDFCRPDDLAVFPLPNAIQACHEMRACVVSGSCLSGGILNRDGSMSLKSCCEKFVKSGYCPGCKPNDLHRLWYQCGLAVF